MQRRSATVAVSDAGDVIGSAIAEKPASKGLDLEEEESEETLADPEPGRPMRPDAFAEAYRQLCQQPGGAWTSEQEIPPFGERR